MSNDIDRSVRQHNWLARLIQNQPADADPVQRIWTSHEQHTVSILYIYYCRDWGPTIDQLALAHKQKICFDQG